MLKISLLLGAVAGLVLAISGVEAAPPNKCIVNGAVTYQQAPCPPDQAVKRPTLAELNAESKARRAAAASSPAPASVAAEAASAPVGRIAPAAPTVSKAFSCDSRQFCSQMKSCDEAKYFLANCPGAKMDGDGNGIPCEKQWCKR